MMIAGFGVLLVCGSYLISQMTAGQDVKIIKDLGIGGARLMGLLIAVFIGVGLVAKELERRSIYSLLSKPLTREQFVLGKYFGLVMTLAVNLGAMVPALLRCAVRIRIYAASAAQRAAGPPGARSAADDCGGVDVRRARDRDCPRAVLFDVHQSMLAFLLTLGLWIAGHFNADLRQFERSSIRRSRRYSAPRLYYVLPNLAPFNVKAEVVHGVAVSALARGTDARLCGGVYHRAAPGRDGGFPRGGISSSGRRAISTSGLLAPLLAVAIACKSGAISGWTPYEPATSLLWLSDVPWFARRSAYHALVADLYWIRAVVYYGRQRLSTARTRTTICCTRSSAWSPPSTRASWPRTVLARSFSSSRARRTEPARPGDQAARTRLERTPERWEFPHDIGFVYAFSLRDYGTAAMWFERAAQLPGAPLWLNTIDRGLHVFARRRPRQCASCVAAVARSQRRSLKFTKARTRPSGAVRRVRRDRPVQCDRVALQSVDWTNSALVGRARRGARDSFDVRSIPHASRSSSNSDQQDVRLSKQSRCCRCPTAMGAPHHDAHATAPDFERPDWARGRQLSQRLHLPRCRAANR